MSATPELPLTGEKRQAIEKMLNGNVIALLAQAPENPTARALVAKQTGLWIPDSLKTFADVKTWLECQALPKHAVAPPARGHIDIAVTGSRTETGRCRYQAVSRTQGNVRLSAETIAAIAENCETPGEFDDALYNAIHDNLGEIDFEWNIDFDDVDNFTTDRYEPLGTDDTDFTWQRGAIRRQALELLALSYPDLAAQLANR